MRTSGSRRARPAIASLLALAVSSALLPGSVAAQIQTNQFVPLSQVQRAAEFQPAPLLYGAYAFVWAAVVVYVYTLWRRIGRVERELLEVNARLTTPRRT